MNKFAKLFETEKYGQILVVLDDVDDCACVTFSFMPEGLGVCSAAPKFGDNWGRASTFFDNVNEASAEAIIDSWVTQFHVLEGSSDETPLH